MEKVKQFEGLDLDGNSVKVELKSPTAQDYRDSQVEYNKVFRQALDSGALLRQKLEDYMVDQGLWNEDKQKENDEFVQEINAKEECLKRGGIPLKEARQIALDLRSLRARFQLFLSERNNLDQNSAEGQADNARFSEIVRLCILNPATKKPYFPTQRDYDTAAAHPWVIEAAAELANIIYGLDPNYDNKLVENKFLKEFNFVNEELRLVNENGHLVDADGRLINEDSRFVAYRSKDAELEQNEDEQYFVDRDGEEVVEITDEDGQISWVSLDMVERKPFLDDQGNPIIVANKEDAKKEEDLVADSAGQKKPARKKRATKAEKDAETK